MKFRTPAAVAAAVVAALFPGVAGGDTTPTYFPESARLDATAYTLRVAGDNRYATAGALARVAAQNLGTQGGYPFEEPDRNEPATSYGFATCPKTVGIAAGDNVADALAAAPVKDLAAFTVDGVTVDLTGGVLLVTQSAREGAGDLSPEVIDALVDLRQSNCTFDAVVFGGFRSVSAGAEETLDAVANTVVRVAGDDRFATAAEIAVSVGAASGLPTVPVFEDAETATEAPNVVILAEAYTGADALSVGPFAAGENVPVLLASGEELPVATRNALLTLQPDTLIVLGGEEALPQAAVDAAAEASGGAEVVRIGGETRYETSVLVAQQLFGIFPPDIAPIFGSGDDTYSNLGLGFARSEGATSDHRGFSDALAAAWFLDTFSDRATAPRRLAPPVELNAEDATTDASGNPAHLTIGGADALHSAPLLLVEQAELPGTVADFVTGLWPDPDAIKTATNPDGVNDGGFGFLFGGEAAVGDEVGFAIAQAVSGSTYDAATASDLNPSLDLTKVFYTAADLTAAAAADGAGVDSGGATGEGDKVCVARGALVGARWLTVYADAADPTAVLLEEETVDYQDEAVGAFVPGESRIQCVSASDLGAVDTLALSLSGHASVVKSLDWADAESVIRTLAPATAPVAGVSGDDITAEATPFTGDTTSVHRYTGPIDVTVAGTTYNDATFGLRLEFTRTDSGNLSQSGGPDSITFEGALTLTVDGRSITFDSVVGESATTGSTLRLVGSYNRGGQRGALVATITGGGSQFTLSDFVIDGLI